MWKERGAGFQGQLLGVELTVPPDGVPASSLSRTQLWSWKLAHLEGSGEEVDGEH